MDTILTGPGADEVLVLATTRAGDVGHSRLLLMLIMLLGVLMGRRQPY